MALIWRAEEKFASYPASMQLMEQKLEQVISDPGQAFVLLGSYDSIYTVGTSGQESDLLEAGNLPWYYTNRGGKVTYHGPGQRVIYPIIHLGYFNKDIRQYLQFLANVIISSLADFGVQSYFCSQNIGIWVNVADGPAKIAAIGIRVSKYFAYHGIAINLFCDMSYFSRIICCGLAPATLQTSLQQLGVCVTFAQFDQVLQHHFCRLLNEIFLR